MEWTTLDPKARWLFYLQAFSRLILFWLPACVFGGVALASVWTWSGAATVATGWFLLQLLLAVWLPALSHARWAYVLRDADLVIARGVIVRAITAIPASRIQHVDTRQGPLEQWLGLARVQIYTASGAGADGTIPGLSMVQAEALRDQLVGIGGDDGV